MEETIVSDSQEQPTQELSVEERFANAIGLGEEPASVEEPVAEESPVEEEEATQEPESEDYAELEINGELYQVPKELKDGYLRQQDYTKKTQEVAAEKQAIQEQRQAVEQERQAFQNQVMAQQQNFQLHAQIASIDQQIAQYSNIDWQQLIDNDPVEAMKLDRGLRELRDSRNAMVQNAIQTQQQLDYQKQQEYMQLIEHGKRQLSEKIPDWSGEKAKSLNQYAVENFGFTPDELNSVVDPRHVEVLHKAWLYDQLQAGKAETLKKVSQAPKTLQKGTQAPKQTQSDVLKKIIKSSSNKYAKHDAIAKLIASKIK